MEYDREELKNKCLDDSTFKNFLDLVPTVKDLINYYYDSKYEKMLVCLDQLKEELKYDYILSPHLDTILKEIRNKAIIQYVTPYTHVDLNIMAKTFNSEVSDFENEIAKLIQNKKIKGRIDSHNKVLCATIRDQKNITIQTILDIGNKFEIDVEKNILRMNMLKNKDFVIKNNNKGKMRKVHTMN
jgi:COP9 signalosome complex subunit 1